MFARDADEQFFTANFDDHQPASISKMERRSDMYISTLSKIIEAMGGELEIVAKMPNGNVKIRQFTQIRQDDSETVSVLS